MNTFAIGIPTLNRYDLLKEALNRYIIDFPTTHIYIVDNGNQGIDDSHPNINVFIPKENLGVAGSWNELCHTIFESHSHALILNDDIYYGKTEGKVLNFINQSNYDFYVGHYYWSIFILPQKTFEKIGSFDEEFYPAYFEDNSYAYRLKLGNCSYHSTNFLTPDVQRNSMTLEKDSTINSTFEDLKKIYERMWGGEPGEEKFITKYNRNLQW